MNTLITLLALLLLAAPLHAAEDVGPQLAHLLREGGLQGAVWTTLDTQGAAGVADARTGTPMRVDHRVQVGSIAKTVLATGILRLVSEGRVRLDTRVGTLLPGIRFDNPWEASDPVRVRHLLDHTAGLDDARLWQVFSLRARPDTPLSAAFPAGSGVLRVRQRPGTRFSYSNMGYTLLGMVVEVIAGQPYERYLDAALLAPLGMHDSSFGFVTQDRDPGLAMGHFEDGVAHPAVPSWVRPAGQFTTTAADMGRLARFLMSDGTVAGQAFIDAALLRRMGAPDGTEAARAGLDVGYGLGLRTVDQHGAIAKCHSGNTVGFRANLCLFPDTQQAFFIAINADSETADYGRFDAVLTRTLRPVPATMPSPVPAHGSTAAAVAAAVADPWTGWYVPAPNRVDSFRFVDIVLDVIHVGSDGRSLRLASLQSAPVTLRYLDGALFQAPGKWRASHALFVTPEGDRVISTGTRSYRQLPAWRMLSLWTSVAAGVVGLACIVARSLARLAMHRMSRRDPLLAPFAGALALLLPIPLFYRQSFLQLGDLTPASALLAAVSAALPLAMFAGLGLSLRRQSISRVDTAAMLAVLQLSLMLAWWDLLPLRLWA